MKEATMDMVKAAFPDRSFEVAKYEYGQVLVIGGSEFYSGAPALSALAAFRSGADMARVIAPERAANIIASFSPILAAYGVEGKRLDKSHLAKLLEMTEAAKAQARGNAAVVIGGGAGRSEETLQVLSSYIAEAEVPMVIDADAIHAVLKDKSVIAGKPILLTPNTYEFWLLTQIQVRELSPEERAKVVEEEAGKLQTTILLKGGVDVISDGTETVLSRAGSPYMSVGGTGDTLAGIAGAFLARGMSPLEAGSVAALVNGKAGELAASSLRDALTAEDVISAISRVIQ
ncbi:MAG: NAD(P)H-hydrate dehydratase [bacterium]|nr:NAD(P)H-hydrate dehydratase [bacterium]